MASPHAAGVAALIVGKWGFSAWRRRASALFPDVVGWLLSVSATDDRLPRPADVHLHPPGAPARRQHRRAHEHGDVRGDAVEERLLRRRRDQRRPVPSAAAAAATDPARR